jgi:sigma-B regulation protein RsbU (phosphoserine phosphatase)
MSTENLGGRQAVSEAILEKFTTVDLGLPGLSAQGQRQSLAEREPSEGPLRWVEPSKRPGEVIGKLASSRAFISQDASVYALAEGMEKNPNIPGVGVVNEERVPVGLVLRQELFDNLGRLYGRDLYKRKLVPTVMKTPRIFRDDLSIFSVADMLNEELSKGTSLHYVLVDGAGRYSGVFSTTDLLIYLSNITARDISLARRLQTAIVKESFSFTGKRTAILGSSATAKEVGGDFYVLKRLVDGKLLIAVCDVSGKGIAASLITAVLGGFFDGYTKSNSIKTFARTLNRYIIDTFSLEYFVTGIIIEFDEDTGEATICDMGHSYMLVMEGAKLMRLGSETANPPLGVLPALSPMTLGYHLKQGSLLVLFTDGVIDQTNGNGRDYTEQRLWSLLKGHGGLSPQQLSEKLTADLASFRGEAPQRDDITFVIMKYGAPPVTEEALQTRQDQTFRRAGE